jgi:isopenicillin-N epimerase
MANPNFGRQLLALWHLAPDATFLNHGSFGACPREVLAAQGALREEMERSPDQFFRKRIMPGGDNAVRQSAEALATFVGTQSDRIAFAENATSAVSAVLMSRSLEPGDEILLLDHAYNAVRLATHHVCRKSGAVPHTVELPIPIRSDDIVARLESAVEPRTRLAVLDHITSPTALVLPIAEMVRVLHAKGVAVLVDGAHGVGQVPLSLDDLGADWYTSNAHKWLYAPKGTAFLYAGAESTAGREAPSQINGGSAAGRGAPSQLAGGSAAGLLPLAISHYNHLGFPQAFDYVGTRDVTSWLSLPAALDFVSRHGADRIMAYNYTIAREGAALLERLGAVPVGPDAMAAAMRALILPQRREAQPADGQDLMRTLWEHHRIQVASSVFQARLLIRVSGQIYLEHDDFERLADALARDGWPGR